MVVLDFETNTRTPMDVLEVAALKLVKKDNTYEVVDVFHRYYYSRYEVDVFALEVHGLDFEELQLLRGDAKYPKYFDEDSDFIKFCEGSSILIAHNISFELYHLNQIVKFENLFCTMKENKKIVGALNISGHLKNPKLAEVCAYYGIEVEEEKCHGALYDAQLTLNIINSMNNTENNHDIISYIILCRMHNEIEENNKKLEQIKRKEQRLMFANERKQVAVEARNARNEWLKNTNCPYCDGKNIHKKDKRQRREVVVQRFMCMDCRKIFQKIIETDCLMMEEELIRLQSLVQK